jgi:hypothetical protein
MVSVPQNKLLEDLIQLSGAEPSGGVRIERGSNWIHPSLRIVETPGCGFGVVANNAIASGTLVVMFGGVVITGAEFEDLPENLQHFPFQVADDLFLGPRDESDIGVGERINHSCAPTVGFSGAIALVTLRDIAQGESITLDYATCVASDDDAFLMECRCGAPSCRGTITGQDWKLSDIQERLLPFYQPFIQAKVMASEAGLSPTGRRYLASPRNDDRVEGRRASATIIRAGIGGIASFFTESLRKEWMAIPICILAGFPSTLATTAVMAMVSPMLREFDFAKSDAGFISALSVLSSIVGYGTYLIAYYAGMLWKERADWIENGKILRGELRRKWKVIQYDFLAHLPSDFWVMPLIGAATGGLFVAGASQFWSIVVANTLADVAYAVKEPFFWHGAKELVAWRERRTTESDTVAL